MTEPLESNTDGPDLPADHWVAALGLTLAVNNPVVTGRCHMVPSMHNPRTAKPRLGIFATLVDMIGGHVPNGPTNPTLDLHVRFTGDVPAAGEVTLVGRPLRVGRRFIVSHVEVRDAGEVVFATGTTTFLNNPMTHDDVRSEAPVAAAIPSFEELLQVRTLADATLEVAPRAQLTNSAVGTIQGGAQAFISELAAERAVGTESATAVDLQINYLSALRVGPLHATPLVRGRVGSLASVEVRLTDAGADHRIVSFVTLLVQP